MGDFLQQNWIGALLVIAMLAMHLGHRPGGSGHHGHRHDGRRHRGCGSHAGHGVSRSREDGTRRREDASPDSTLERQGQAHTPTPPAPDGTREAVGPSDGWASPQVDAMGLPHAQHPQRD
jgi:hypothetical protein